MKRNNPDLTLDLLRSMGKSRAPDGTHTHLDAMLITSALQDVAEVIRAQTHELEVQNALITRQSEVIEAQTASICTALVHGYAADAED